MLIGITGGVATGKSTVTRLLRERGATTFSADEASRAVLTHNSSALREIFEAFGAGMFSGSGDLDRSALGALIFSDPAARTVLNRIMHPRIRRLLADQIRSAQEDVPPTTIIAVEIPLLYEGNLDRWFEQIVVVAASLSAQVSRLILNKGLTADEAKACIASQMPMEEKTARATHVVHNSGTEKDLALQVDKLWKAINKLDNRLDTTCS